MTIYPAGTHSAGSPITLAAVDPQDALDAGATLQVPLDPMGGPAGSTVLFYAANPGAFVDLGADTRRIFGLDGAVIIDGHLAIDPGVQGVNGLAESTAINRAVGILIEQGCSPAEAQRQLRRRAADVGSTVRAAAEQLIRAASEPPGGEQPPPPES